MQGVLEPRLGEKGYEEIQCIAVGTDICLSKLIILYFRERKKKLSCQEAFTIYVVLYMPLK